MLASVLSKGIGNVGIFLSKPRIITAFCWNDYDLCFNDLSSRKHEIQNAKEDIENEVLFPTFADRMLLSNGRTFWIGEFW